VKTPEQLRAEEEVKARQLDPPTDTPVVLADAPPLRTAVVPPPAPQSAPATVAPVVTTTPRPRRRHVRKSAPVEPAVPPPAPVALHRSLTTDMETRFVDAAPSKGEVGVPRGAMIRCKLTAPANPSLAGPVTFVVTADYSGPQGVLIPKGSTGICSPSSLAMGRVGLACDTLTIKARGATTISGLALGRDQQPGIPVGAANQGPSGPSVGSRAKDRAVGLGTSLLGAAVGGGVIGEVTSAAAQTGADSIRDNGSYSYGNNSVPAPRGSPFTLFIQRSF
jgi:hypothetical protein